MNRIIVSPSILSADFADFGKTVSEIEASGAEWLHIDVMDGSFVPNITFGQQLVSALRKKTSLFMDIHLMTIRPSGFFNDFKLAGADSITFHYEAEVHIQKFLSELHNLGLKAGIAVVPSTPVHILEDIMPFIDLALVMTVNPGFGGQTLIPECLKKVKKLSKMRDEAGLNFRISVDGGINESIALQAKEAGADVFVMGTAFSDCKDKKNLVNRLQI